MAEDRIPTNLRTLLIVEAMAGAESPLTPTEINDRIGLPKQTIHRLCATLETEGFLIRTADGKKLQPSRRLTGIGQGLLQSRQHDILRHQILETVAAKVRETINYVIPQETGMHYLDRVETDWPFRVQLPVGSNVPFHCTASGKTFMASLSGAVRRRFVQGLTLESKTSQTITDPDQLLSELKAIAKRGYAIDNEEFLEGMVALAVPVTDPEGRYVASLAFHGPCQRITVQEVLVHKDALVDGARRLREVMFS